MVMENSLTASRVPNLLPVLSKPIKAVFPCKTVILLSQFEGSPEIWILQGLSQDPNKNPISKGPVSLEIPNEALRRLRWKKRVEHITRSRHHSTIAGWSFLCSPVSKVQSFLSR